MDFITFCECGRPIDESFVYCPWCGKRRGSSDETGLLDSVFSQLETKQTENRTSRVNKILKKIEELEKELDTITEKVKHKNESK